MNATSRMTRSGGQYQQGPSTDGSCHTAISAFPVTAAKVVMFLEHETAREKVSCCPLFLPSPPCLMLAAFLSQRKRGSSETIAGSSVGKSHIAQVISALEYWRFQNHHLYMHTPEAQVSLRNDNLIRTL
jgi:hypothetical protein